MLYQVPIPWLHLLRSPAVWAIVIAHFCNNWGFYTLLTCMPTYFKQALPSLQINSAVSAETQLKTPLYLGPCFEMLLFCAVCGACWHILSNSLLAACHSGAHQRSNRRPSADESTLNGNRSKDHDSTRSETNFSINHFFFSRILSLQLFQWVLYFCFSVATLAQIHIERCPCSRLQWGSRGGPWPASTSTTWTLPPGSLPF